MPCRDKNFEMFKILVMTKFRNQVVNYVPTVREHVGTMQEDACQCWTVRAMPRLSRIATDSSRTAHVEFTSSSRTVQEQFTTNAWQWRSRRCVGIYKASWTLLAIPEIASEETTYITETTCHYKKADEMARLATTKSWPKVMQVSALHYPFPHNDTFWCPWETSLLKTLWEKEKLLITSNISFSQSVFYPFG